MDVDVGPIYWVEKDYELWWLMMGTAHIYQKQPEWWWELCLWQPRIMACFFFVFVFSPTLGAWIDVKYEHGEGSISTNTRYANECFCVCTQNAMILWFVFWSALSKWVVKWSQLKKKKSTWGFYSLRLRIQNKQNQETILSFWKSWYGGFKYYTLILSLLRIKFMNLVLNIE